MLEHVHIRINDHQIIEGVKEYSVEVSVAGRYTRTFIGTNAAEFLQNVNEAFTQIFTLLGIPQNQPQAAPLPVQEAPPEHNPASIPTVLFFNADGTPQQVSPFAAKANARFDAQVIRNGKVVED
jgi:hypothetical protein